MLLPTDGCRCFVKTCLRSVILFGLLLFIPNLVKGQNVNVTSPATDPSTYGVGTTISLSSNPDAGFLGTVTGVSYSLPPLGSKPGLGVTFTTNFSTSTLAFGSYTLTATLTYSTALILTNTKTQTLTINIVPASPTATPVTICSGSTASIAVSGGSPTGGTYNLYSAAIGGTLLATSTTGPLITPVNSATTTYYASYISGGFESLRTPVTVTASTSPATPAFTATPTTVATGANATITLTPIAGLTYSWTFSGGTAIGTGDGPFSVSWATGGAKLITVTAANAGGCTSTATQIVTVTKTIASGNYAFSQPISFLPTGAGADVSNFPVLVYIKEDALKTGVNCATNVKFPTGGTNGYDFAFTTVGGTNELFYQVESFDPVTGTLLAWVQVPTLSNTNTTNLTFYFGSLTPAHPVSFGNATWSTDYQAVYHFSEAAAAGITTADATANLHTGTANNLTAASNSTGIIGSNAYTFDGSSTSVTANPVNISSSFTLSAWVKINATGKDQKIMTNQSAFGSASGGYKLGVYTDNTIEAESPQGNRNSTPAATPFTTTGWHYVQGVFNTVDKTLRTYVDGAANKILSGATTLPSSLNGFNIGVGEGGFSLWFNGIIDEVRVSNAAKASEWIKAEYLNQTNYLTFTTSTAAITGNAANAAAIGGSIVYTWTGAIGTATNTPGNWTIPTTGNPVAAAAPPINGTASLNIPNVTNKPILSASGAYYGVTVASGSSLSLGGFTLTVGCNVYNSGTINAAGTNTSTLAWNGTFTPQLYTGTNTANTAQLGNFIVNNTAASGIVRITGGPVNIYNTVTLTNGSLDVNNAGNGALTLKSSSTVTAGVAQIPTGLSITGTVVVERWFKGGTASSRSYRLMSSPVNNSGNIPITASSAFNFSSLKTNLLFTGTGGTANGFDASPTNGPTVLFYNTVADNYTRLATITSPRPVGSGFYFYFRGDNINNISNKSVRVGGVYATPEANVVGLQSGTLNQGSLIFPLTSGGFGYNMAGNPYPSSISLPASALTNTTPFVYTYNPAGTSITTQTPPFVLGSGQGFYVRTIAPAATITFAESYKTATQPTALAFNLLNNLEGNITLQMVQDSANYDFAQLRFADKYKPAYYNLEDADDLNGSGQVVFFGAMTSDNHLVAIGSQPIDKMKTSVFLSVDDNASGLFTMKRTDLSNIPKVYDVWLMDHFKQDSLDLRVHDNYNFNIDKANAATFGNNRFEIVIRKKSLPPYQLLSFAGNKSIAAITLDWNTLNEYDYTNFELQKSTDGKSFETIQQVSSASLGSYSYKDFNLSTTAVYYRLKQTDINDVVSYSKVIIISAKGGGTLSIFPNPASNTIQFSLDQQINTGIHLRIYNATGVQVKSNDFNSSTGQQDISSLKPGAYTIDLVDNASKKTLLTGKFIKVE